MPAASLHRTRPAASTFQTRTSSGHSLARKPADSSRRKTPGGAMRWIRDNDNDQRNRENGRSIHVIALTVERKSMHSRSLFGTLTLAERGGPFQHARPPPYHDWKTCEPRCRFEARASLDSRCRAPRTLCSPSTSGASAAAKKGRTTGERAPDVHGPGNRR